MNANHKSLGRAKLGLSEFTEIRSLALTASIALFSIVGSSANAQALAPDQEVRCESIKYKEKTCRIPPEMGPDPKVQLLRQESTGRRGDCTGKWSVSNGWIVVRDGCRAVFLVQARSVPTPTPPPVEPDPNERLTTFIPVRFNDPAVSQRSDIKDILAGQQLSIPAALNVAWTTISLQDLRVTFFKETARVLETISQPFVYPPQTDRQIDRSCSANQRLVTALSRLQLKSESSCSGARSALQNALQSLSVNACIEAYEPERYFGRISQVVPEEYDLSHLESLIEVAGFQLYQNPLPKTLIDNGFQKQARQILSKLRKAPLSAALDAQQSALAPLAQVLSGPSACVANSESELSAISSTLSSAQTESRAATNYLNDLEQSGIQQARAERQAVLAQRLKRVELPYPSLTDDDRRFVAFYLGGVYWRMRGGGLYKLDSTRKARRLFNQMPMQAISTMAGGPEIGVPVGDAIYDRISKGWGDYMDMGRTPGEGDLYYDAVYMNKRGEYQVEAAVSVLKRAKFDPWLVQAAGLQMSPCYLYTWDKLPLEHRLGPNPRVPERPLIDGQLAWAEMCIGGTISLAITNSLLAGAR